jgi:ADP-ribose pyrophosphatase YjhB (NUDIX family)
LASAPKHIEVIARALALREGKLLLCRNVSNGYAFLPGGHVEPGEPAAVALAREFKEECGLGVVVSQFLVANEHIFSQGGKPHHEINLVFHVEQEHAPWPERVSSLEPEIAFEWTDPAAFAEAQLLPPPLLAWLLAGGPESGDGPWLGHVLDQR